MTGMILAARSGVLSHAARDASIAARSTVRAHACLMLRVTEAYWGVVQSASSASVSGQRSSYLVHDAEQNAIPWSAWGTPVIPWEGNHCLA